MTDEALFLIPWPFDKLDTTGNKQVFKYAFHSAPPLAQAAGILPHGVGLRFTASRPHGPRGILVGKDWKVLVPQNTHILVYSSGRADPSEMAWGGRKQAFARPGGGIARCR